MDTIEKVKVFKFNHNNDEKGNFESSIGKFIDKGEYEIINILQSSSGNITIVTIWYTKIYTEGV